MKFFSSFSLLAFALTSACAQAQVAPPVSAVAPTQNVVITVQPGARQTFAGLGTSLGNWGLDYQKLSPAERAQLSRMLWHDLNMKSLRLWVNLNEYAPGPQTRDLSFFRKRYLDSGLIADARKNGVTTLLLAPDNAPPYLKVKRQGGPEDYAVPDANLPAYATVIADLIKQVRDETGVLINVTGVQNEPNDLDRIAPEQMPAVVKALRSALDARGLNTVQVIAPEAANVDWTMTGAEKALRADPLAWASLAGIASHSYSMAATEEAASFVAGADGLNTKSYWMTEASANGPEAPGDALQAASLATRFLSDMNHRVTHWIHFLGFETPDPNDNATRILAYTTGPLRITKFQKYDYYRALSQTFAVGARFRKSLSDREGDMTWTYGPKPRLTLAAAQNPDGSWAIGLSNFTAPQFSDKPGNDGFQNGFKAQTFDVTVRVPELAKAQGLRFRVHRNGPSLDVEEAPLLMRGGVLTIHGVGPLQLVTLRSPLTDTRF